MEKFQFKQEKVNEKGLNFSEGLKWGSMKTLYYEQFCSTPSLEDFKLVKQSRFAALFLSSVSMARGSHETASQIPLSTWAPSLQKNTLARSFTFVQFYISKPSIGFEFVVATQFSSPQIHLA